MKIEIRKSAIKDLKKVQRQYKEKIHRKIKELARFPDLPNLKKLSHFEPAYRLRVGDYRILFDAKDGKVIIARILHRKDSYK